MKLAIEEKLNILKDEYLSLIINLDCKNKPTFDDYLSRRPHPIIGKIVFKNNNWFLV